MKNIANRPNLKALLKKIINIEENIRSNLGKLRMRKVRETVNEPCKLNRLFTKLFKIFLTVETK